MSDEALKPPPPSLVAGARTHFGRFGGPVPDPNIRAKGIFGRYRLKEWHYVSIVADDAVVAVAMVQLGYVAKAFAYAIDMRAGWRIADFSSLSPLGRSVRFAPSSVSGETRFEQGNDRITVSAQTASGEPGWRIELDVALNDGSRLAGGISVVRNPGFSLCHRLPSGNAAYTHKDAAMAAVADLEWGQRAIRGVGVAGSDWTRSIAMRDTRWNWAALNHTLDDGRRVGLNLSAHVYDDANGDSEENVFFVDGRSVPLGGAIFEIPPRPDIEPWRIRSKRPDEFDLEFHPRGAHREDTNAFVLRSRFVQPYGQFRGFVRLGAQPLRLDGGIGVVEDHVARW